jgi:DNA-binding beta-propeller fold protein YncE
MLAAASLAAGAQTLLTQIPLPSSANLYTIGDVAVNSATNRIYVPVQISDGTNGSLYDYFRVLVINGATNQVVHNLANFPSGSPYLGIAIDPVRNLTYVEMGINSSFETPNCTVSVVDGQTEETVKTIQLPSGDCGTMAVDPVTGKVYIRAASELDVIASEATGNIETFSLPAVLVGGAFGLAASPYAHRLYFTYNNEPQLGAEWLGFFDTLDNEISKEMFIPAGIEDDAHPVVNPETGNIFGTSTTYLVYPIQGYTDSLTVFNSRGSLLATIVPPVSGAFPPYLGTASILGLGVDPKANLAFAFAETSSGTAGATVLYKIDGISNTILSSASAALPYGSSLVGGKVAVNPDTGKIYVLYGEIVVNNGSSANQNFQLRIYSEQ